MFRSAILFVALFCAACGSRFGSAGSAAPAAGAEPRGRIIVLSDSLLSAGGCDTVRFGRLHSGEIAVARFRFENRCSRPLVLLSYERSCGCTSLAFDSAPFLPGDFLPVELTFDSRGERGWQFKPVVLRFAESASFRLFVDVDVE